MRDEVPRVRWEEVREHMLAAPRLSLPSTNFSFSQIGETRVRGRGAEGKLKTKQNQLLTQPEKCL